MYVGSFSFTLWNLLAKSKKNPCIKYHTEPITYQYHSKVKTPSVRKYENKLKNLIGTYIFLVSTPSTHRFVFAQTAVT